MNNDKLSTCVKCGGDGYAKYPSGHCYECVTQKDIIKIMFPEVKHAYKVDEWSVEDQIKRNRANARKRKAARIKQGGM